MQSCDILAYGLTDTEIERFGKVMLPNYSVHTTECATDLIATVAIGIVVNISRLSPDDLAMLLDFYCAIGDFSEAVILIGDITLPNDLTHKIRVFSSFELMEQQSKFIFMEANRKQKKNQNFSNVLANVIFVLSSIRKTPGISTKELAEKLEISTRSVQRYIETLRIAGEWIEYDPTLKGWKLSVGKSILWGDF